MIRNKPSWPPRSRKSQFLLPLARTAFSRRESQPASTTHISFHELCVVAYEQIATVAQWLVVFVPAPFVIFTS